MRRPPARVFGFLLFCLLMLAMAWSGLRWVETFPQKVANALEEKALALGSKFAAIAHFQPRLRVERRIISETSSAISELAVLEKALELEREFVHTWAGSTKTVRLRGKYRVKVGYNLLHRFEIQLEKGQTRIVLPPATVLSVEQQEMHVEALENGFWNPVSAQDLETGIAELHEQARGEGAKLIPQADEQFLRQLHDLGDRDAVITRELP